MFDGKLDLSTLQDCLSSWKERWIDRALLTRRKKHFAWSRSKNDNEPIGGGFMGTNYLLVSCWALVETLETQTTSNEWIWVRLSQTLPREKPRRREQLTAFRRGVDRLRDELIHLDRLILLIGRQTARVRRCCNKVSLDHFSYYRPQSHFWNILHPTL